MKEDNIVLDKSFDFAVRIVNMCKYLQQATGEKVISRQVLRSGTSIGVNIREALRSQSRNEFISKINIPLKEAYETEYWIELLFATKYIGKQEYDSIFAECRDLTNILAKIVITSKQKDT